MIDHRAQVDAWLWHLRGWRQEGEFHKAPLPVPAHNDTRAALHASLTTPRPLKLDELERITSGALPYMGPAARPAPTGEKGRPSTLTQYDQARQRRDRLAGLLARHVHQRVSLPTLGEKAGWLADDRFALIVREVLADSSVKRREQAHEVEKRFYRVTEGRGRQPCRTAIQDALNKVRG